MTLLSCFVGAFGTTLRLTLQANLVMYSLVLGKCRKQTEWFLFFFSSSHNNNLMNKNFKVPDKQKEYTLHYKL